MNTLSFGLVVLVMGIVHRTAASTTDYCNSTLCSDNVQHIACGHSGDFAATCPADAAIVEVTPELKQLLVDGHNEKRNFIAGGNHANHSAACRMATMQWDDELADLAELNVRQCAMKHDKCRNTDEYAFSGQNLASMWFSVPVDPAYRFQRAIDMWYREVENSQQAFMDEYPTGYTGPKIGHFTIMVKDRNIRLGCAAATYSRDADSVVFLVACNYATTNVLGYSTYESCPVAAEDCTTGTNPDYPNLCSSAEVYSSLA